MHGKKKTAIKGGKGAKTEIGPSDRRMCHTSTYTYTVHVCYQCENNAKKATGKCKKIYAKYAREAAAVLGWSPRKK